MNIKAIIPAAGFGTRMLPFAKSVPKEMLPLVNKPVIQYVVEEAIDAGINEILIVLSKGKEAIKEHFSHSDKLNELFAKKNFSGRINSIRKTFFISKNRIHLSTVPPGIGRCGQNRC